MLPPANRLRRTFDFRRVYERSRTFTTPSIIFRFRPNDRSHIRVGIVVSSRVSKKATVRNRIRRRLREAMRRALKHVAAPYDIILAPRRPAAERKFSDLVQECQVFLGRIQNITVPPLPKGHNQ